MNHKYTYIKVFKLFDDTVHKTHCPINGHYIKPGQSIKIQASFFFFFIQSIVLSHLLPYLLNF